MKKVALPLGIAALAAGALLLGGVKAASAAPFYFSAGTAADVTWTATDLAVVNAPVSTTFGGSPTADLDLTGLGGSGGIYDFTILTVGGGSPLFGKAELTTSPDLLTISSLSGFGGDGFLLQYKAIPEGLGSNPGVPAVPEASSFMSFGALLALGALAVARRRRIA
jgi:MYXO-CTERM domain-containing protein